MHSLVRLTWIAVLGSAGLGACGGSADSTTPVTPVTPVVPAAGMHGLTVLFPPTKPNQAYYSDVLTYLVNNPSAPVDGANFSVSWSSVDKGPGANPQYDFSSVDSLLQPWIHAGKKVNLTVSGVTYGTGTTSLVATPAYVQLQASILNCTSSSPAFWQQGYFKNYQALMAAVVQHYGSNPSVGYIRFGLGIGGETTIVMGFSSADCQAQLTAAGFSTPVWLAYLGQMLDYEKSLNSPVQLMVGINILNFNNPDYSIPDSTAAMAVRNGIGFGSQGLQAGDITDYAAGRPCTVDWCKMFVKYDGTVPLELQTVALSDPSGAGMTGSLVPLLQLGVQLHARNFEIYYEDWLTAFDPAYPAYAQYHTAYQQAILTTSAAVAK